MLGEVCVLVFVDQYVGKIVAVPPAKVGIVAQQHVGVVEEIVEVHGSGDPAPFVVRSKNIGGAAASGRFVGGHKLTVGGVVGGRVKIVFRIRYVGHHLSGTVYFIIEIHLFDNRADQRFGVGCVVYGEVASESDQVGVAAQHT